MSAASLLARGRTFAEQLMVDTCLIRRKTGETTDSDGVVTPTWSTVYSGPCRMKQANAQANAQDVGEAALLMLRFELQLPVTGTEGIQADDQATITASALDPDLVNRKFAVRGLSHASLGVMRRLQVEETTSGPQG